MLELRDHGAHRGACEPFTRRPSETQTHTSVLEESVVRPHTEACTEGMPSIRCIDSSSMHLSLSVYALSHGAHVMVSGAARRRRAAAATRFSAHCPHTCAHACAMLDCRYICCRCHAPRPRASDRQAAHMLGENLNYDHPPDAQTTRGYAPASSSCFSNFSLRAQASAGALSLVKSRSENCKPDLSCQCAIIEGFTMHQC